MQLTFLMRQPVEQRVSLEFSGKSSMNAEIQIHLCVKGNSN